MNELIHIGRRIARKEHVCDAYHTIMDYGDFEGFTWPELKAIARMKRQKGKILKGQEYIRQVGKQDGDLWTWKGTQELYDICNKYDMFED